MKKQTKLSNVTVKNILEFDRDAKMPPRSILEALSKKQMQPIINLFYSKNGEKVNHIREEGLKIIKEWFEIGENGEAVIETLKTPIESTKVISLADRIKGTKLEQEFKEEQVYKMQEGKLRDDAMLVLDAFHKQVIQIEI
jgi:hypothetical protein